MKLASELKLADVIDILTDLILVVSPEFKILEANLAANAVLGKGNSIRGSLCHRVFRDKETPCSDCPLSESILTGQVKSIQYFDKRFGEFFEERIQPVMDDQGELSRIILTNRNVTAIRETEERSSHEKKLAAIGKLSSGAAHDFNNVIAGVLGRVHLMRKGANSADLCEHLDGIEDAVKTGSETVRRMLEYAKGEISRSMEILDLKKLMDIVVFITQPKWINLPEEKGIIVSLKTELDDNIHIRGNKSELTNAFTNLVINAVDAMPDGGVLNIKCKRQDSVIKVIFKDTGTGMTPDIVDRIFDPFFSTKGKKGTGLGLSEVFGTVKRHQAKIEVDSKVGYGTTFTIEFSAQEAPQPIKDAHKGELPGYHILAVDDEEYLLDTLEDILTEEGHAVDCFLKPEEALKALESSQYDLIITDFEMPGMDGREFAHRAKSVRPMLPVVLLSGWPIALDSDVDMAGVIDAVLTKPFTLDDINGAFHTLSIEK